MKVHQLFQKLFMHDKVEGEQRLRRLTTIVITGSSLHRVGICISEPSGNEEEDTNFFWQDIDVKA